jgi:hypothetical protein
MRPKSRPDNTSIKSYTRFKRKVLFSKLFSVKSGFSVLPKNLTKSHDLGVKTQARDESNPTTPKPRSDDASFESYGFFNFHYFLEVSRLFFMKLQKIITFRGSVVWRWFWCRWIALALSYTFDTRMMGCG